MHVASIFLFANRGRLTKFCLWKFRGTSTRGAVPNAETVEVAAVATGGCAPCCAQSTRDRPRSFHGYVNAVEGPGQRRPRRSGARGKPRAMAGFTGRFISAGELHGGKHFGSVRACASFARAHVRQPSRRAALDAWCARRIRSKEPKLPHGRRVRSFHPARDTGSRQGVLGSNRLG